MPVHLSIHDVSPAWASEVELALEYSADAGARPALLVVPNFHGEWPLLEHPEFCARLRELQASGHEIFLHGFYHAAGMGAGGSAPSAFETLSLSIIFFRYKDSLVLRNVFA